MSEQLLGTCSDILVELFSHHGVVAQEADGVVTIPKHPGYKLALEVYSTEYGSTIQLRATFVLKPGQAMVETLAGVGDTQEEAVMDAQTAFLNTVFFVWLSAILGAHTEYAEVLDWTVNQVLRKVTIGSICARNDVGVKDRTWEKAWHATMRKAPLAEGLHWVDFYYCHIRGETAACQVWLDNELNEELELRMREFDWPESTEFYSVRQFMILSGGFDCADLLPEFAEDLQEEQLVASLIKKKVPPAIADRYVRLGPLAFGRRLLEGYPVTVQHDAVAINADTIEALAFNLDDDWIYREMQRLARTYPGGLTEQEFEAVAHRSAEVHGVSQVLEAGHELTGASMQSIMVPYGAEAFRFVQSLPSVRALNAQQAKALEEVFHHGQ